MPFEILDTLTLPGDPAKPNEDAVLAEDYAAVVFDGATPMSEPLMPGKSDAAWIAQFGARRLMSHLKAGDTPRAALRHALADAEHSFAGLRRRPMQERYELPCASMMLAVPHDGGIDALWYGDCAALVQEPDGACSVVGDAAAKRGSEAERARKLAASFGVAPAAALSRAEFLPQLRASRATINSAKGGWLFSPEPQASEHVKRARIAPPPGSLILLCTDGFQTLLNDYEAYDLAGLFAAVRDKGLAALGAEIRAIEAGDAEGRRFARFKKSDDTTAVLVKLV